MSGIPVQAEMFETGLGGYLRPVTEKPMSGYGLDREKRVATPKQPATGQGGHGNSRASYRDTVNLRRDRRGIVLGLFSDNPNQSFTDREVLARIYPGSGDLNMVRPRITELIESDDLIECGSVSCPVTGKTVRECRLNGCDDHGGADLNTRDVGPKPAAGAGTHKSLVGGKS